MSEDTESRFSWSRLVKEAHQREHFPGVDGYEYKTTWAWEGEPFDKTAPPPGERWELNVDTADGGYEKRRSASGQTMVLVHWRQKRNPDEDGKP